jgi:hypothetical protein
MILKTTLLAALGAVFIAAPAAVQAQPDRYHHHYVRHPYHHRCGLIRRGEYGVFGHYRKRLTLGCQ